MDLFVRQPKEQPKNTVTTEKKLQNLTVCNVTQEEAELLRVQAQKERRSISNYLLHAGLSRAQEEVSE